MDIMRLREENEVLMNTLVRSKLEMAETQSERLGAFPVTMRCISAEHRSRGVLRHRHCYGKDCLLLIHFTAGTMSARVWQTVLQWCRLPVCRGADCPCVTTDRHRAF